MVELKSETWLPLHLDEITPEWITEILQEQFPGVTVTSIKCEDERFGTAASARFDLEYGDTADQDPPATVYVKGGFDDKWRKRTWGALQQEARFFAELAPDIPLNIPKSYYAAINSEPQGIVVLEDLARRGVSFGHNLNPVSADQVASVLEAVSVMHGKWWESPRLKDYVDWREAQRQFLQYLLRPKHFAELTEWKHGDKLVEAIGTGETGVKALHALWEVMDGLPRTFVHGDLHGGNIFYEADGRPGFHDWQLCFSGNFAHDMAWIIVTAFTVDQRRAHEEEMIRHYIGALQANGGPQLGFDEVWLLYRQNMAHAIPSYGCVPRDNGPKEVLEGAAERVFNAAIDLDVLGALGLSKG